MSTKMIIASLTTQHKISRRRKSPSGVVDDHIASCHQAKASSLKVKILSSPIKPKYPLFKNIMYYWLIWHICRGPCRFIICPSYVVIVVVICGQSFWPQGLIIETSYLPYICTHAPFFCIWNIKST